MYLLRLLSYKKVSPLISVQVFCDKKRTRDFNFVVAYCSEIKFNAIQFTLTSKKAKLQFLLLKIRNLKTERKDLCFECNFSFTALANEIWDFPYDASTRSSSFPYPQLLPTPPLLPHPNASVPIEDGKITAHVK